MTLSCNSGFGTRGRTPRISCVCPNFMIRASGEAAKLDTTASKVLVMASSYPLHYPQTRQVEQVDDYHGVTVRDPYRWLEDLDSEETKAWIEAQNQLTFGYLEQIPARDRLRERLTEVWNYEKFGVPFKEGDRYFYFKNDGLQNQSVLYTLTDLDGEPQVLIDPNQLSGDGTIALSGLAVSDNAQLVAYGLSASGSDWQEWKYDRSKLGKTSAIICAGLSSPVQHGQKTIEAFSTVATPNQMKKRN